MCLRFSRKRRSRSSMRSTRINSVCRSLRQCSTSARRRSALRFGSVTRHAGSFKSSKAMASLSKVHPYVPQTPSTEQCSTVGDGGNRYASTPQDCIRKNMGVFLGLSAISYVHARRGVMMITEQMHTDGMAVGEESFAAFRATMRGAVLVPDDAG